MMSETYDWDWVEVSDPSTKLVYYANPSTGECLWQEKPTAGSIKPPNPNGDWWELWDDKNQLPYYYHTELNLTQWNKPEEDVVSLVKIQQVRFFFYYCEWVKEGGLVLRER
ncbi:hypothetical protein BDC45DRAFT_502115 [Circinella umbellata]|nr:hypothetical protein BDC45DRAFT_502115 [Circinella umbellata]